MQIYTCNGGTNQKWKLNPNGTITAQNSGLCLDVTGNKTANSTPVAVWTCNGQNNQKWTSSLAAPDTTPPSVPGNARTSNLTCDAVTFAWNASTDGVGVAFYDVYHDGQLMTTVSGSTLSTNLTVVAGVKWGLYVNARDAAGNVSQASSTVYVTPPQCQVDTTPPSAPGTLVGTASGTTVTLTWGAASDDVSVRAYDVYRNGTKVGGTTGTATVLPNTTFVDSSLIGQHELRVLRRRAGRPAELRTEQQHRQRHDRRGMRQLRLRRHADRDRQGHPLGPRDAARRLDPLHPTRRAEHRPAEPDDRCDGQRGHRSQRAVHGW